MMFFFLTFIIYLININQHFFIMNYNIKSVLYILRVDRKLGASRHAANAQTVA
jgi:hypothetical protein